ncbi:hypothetical protein [Lysobacter tyrosinilyticus]
MNGAVANPPKWALVIGHPGHELRVLGWLRRERPVVAVLTDGSGHGSSGRIAQTTEILQACGVAIGEVHGQTSDREIYAAILSGDAAPFLAFATRLAEWLCEHAIDCVASDGIEGYNPTHDLCAALTARAARLATARRGQRVRHYTFPLVGPAVPSEVPPQALRIVLDEGQLTDKLALSRRYAASAGGTLVEEVEEMIARLGCDAFREEMLLPTEVGDDFAAFDAALPFYESHGERQVAAGHYRDVIRFRQHIKPLLYALEN